MSQTSNGDEDKNLCSWLMHSVRAIPGMFWPLLQEPECIPLLKLLLPEFNLAEAYFANVRTDIHRSKWRWAEGWRSAGGIWQWHLLKRQHRVKPRQAHPQPQPVGVMRAGLKLTLTSFEPHFVEFSLVAMEEVQTARTSRSHVEDYHKAPWSWYYG